MRKQIGLGFLSLVCAVLLSGCSTAPPTGSPEGKVWYKPGVSAEDTKQVLASCQYEALLSQRSTSIQADTVGDALIMNAIASSQEKERQKRLVHAAMTSMGFTLVDKNSHLLQQAGAVSTAETLKSKAENGDADAQFNLGTCFFNGSLGLTQDLAQAIYWYERAASNDFPNISPPLANAPSISPCCILQPPRKA